MARTIKELITEEMIGICKEYAQEPLSNLLEI